MRPSASGFVDLEVLRALCIGSNQDGTRIGVGHEDGFTVFSMMNAAQQHRRMLLATSLDMDATIGSTSSDSDDSPQLVEDFRFPRFRGGQGGRKGSRAEDEDEDSDSLIFQRQPGLEGSAESPAKATRVGDPAEFGYGVGAIALLGDTRFVAVAGGGKRPVCPTEQVHIYDRDTLLRSIVLESPVRRVLMVGTRLLATLTTKSLHLHTFTGISLFEGPAAGGELHNPPMPLAACPFSSTIAYAETENRVQLICHRDDPEVSRLLPSAVTAHVNPITALALSPEGSLFATCSERGTLIRVWRSVDGTPVSEVRNSSTASVIRQLCFVGTSHLFCVSNDKVKVFFAQGQPPETQPWEDRTKALAGNAQLGTYLKALSVLSTYFASQWAMCECPVPPNFTPSCLQKQDAAASSTASATSMMGSAAAAAASSTITAVTGWVSGLWRPSSSPPAPSPSSSTNSPAVAEAAVTAAPGRSGYYTAKSLDDLVLLKWECYARVGKGPQQQQQQSTTPKDLLIISCEGAVLRVAFDPVKGTVTPLATLEAAPSGS